MVIYKYNWIGVIKYMKNIQKTSKLTKNNSSICILIYILAAMLIAIVIKVAMKGEEPISIAENAGQEYFLNVDYENALKEYETLQVKEKWPGYNMEIAKIYSVKGDYIKSNEYIEKAYEMRNVAIDEGDKEKYKDKDIKLINNIIVTSIINGEFEKAVSYCEVFLNDYPDNMELIKTAFMAYLFNNNIAEAQAINITYNMKSNNSADMAVGAKMQALLNDYESSIETLKEAFKKDNNEMTVFDVLVQIYNENEEETIKALEKEVNDKKDKEVYDLFLAKVYSLNEENYQKSEEYLNKVKYKFYNTINYKFIEAEIFKNSNLKEAKKILSSISEENEENYIGAYAKALERYYCGDYEGALNACKESILLNKDYTANYSEMIPKIINKIKSDETNPDGTKKQVEEPYLLMALEKEPYNCKLILNMADYYNNIVLDTNKALYYYELASKIKPQDCDIIYKRALIKINMQRNDEAYELLKEGIEIEKDDSRFRRALGALYLTQEKNDEAIAQIRKAYKIDKDDILNLSNAGCYYIAVANDKKRALTNFEAAYEGIGKAQLTSEQVKIITDNYNRIKALDDNSKTAFTLADFKLFY